MAVVLLAAPICHALDASESVYQYAVHSWRHQGGLPDDRINAIVQTKDGCLWLGVDNGLVRFDGREFVAVDAAGVAGQKMVRLASDRHGGFWYLTASGNVGHYGESGFAPTSAVGSLSERGTAFLVGRTGDLWIGTDSRLTCWKGGVARAASPLDSALGPVLSLCEDASGRIWIGTSGQGLFVWSAHGAEPLGEAALRQRRIQALAADSSGHIWIGTDTGLRCYDATGRRVAIPVLNADVRTLMVDASGDVWVGTANAGVARYHAGAFGWLRTANGLASDGASALLEDHEQNVWIGSRDGLSQLSEVKFPIVSSREGLITGTTHAVSASHRGGLWISSNGGITYFDGRTATNYADPSLFPNVYIKLVFEARNGDVYTADGDKSIAIISAGRVKARIHAQTWPEAFAEDAESVLVNVGPTLYRIRGDKLEPYEYNSNRSPSYDWITNLAIAADGSILIPSSNGFFRVKDGDARRWSTAQGLSGNAVQFAFEDVDGSVWLGLTTGLTRIKAGQVRNLTEVNGLPDPRIFAIVPDDLGYFWIMTGRGLVRVSRTSLNTCADGRASHIGAELFEAPDALKSVSRTDQTFSGCRTSDGRIWFPNPEGVIMVDPARYYINHVPPPIRIEEINANGKGRVGPATAGQPVEFGFSAISFVSPRKVHVSYRLVGLDDSWVDAGDRRSIRYANLPAGRFEFQVQAANADGIENTRTLAFELAPPFYRTIWFYSAGGTTLALLIFGGYRWKDHRMRALQRKLQQDKAELEAKVAERTRELVVEQARLKQTHQQLVEVSREAGMAEVATNVLHNVGNVLNSVNVSAELVLQDLRRSRLGALPKVSELLESHAADLSIFLTQDPKGVNVVPYLSALGCDLAASRDRMMSELEGLTKNIDHIKDIVGAQQSLAARRGFNEKFALHELVEDALRLDFSNANGRSITIVREYEAAPVLNLERYKVLEIVVNLIRNARDACTLAEPGTGTITVRVANNGMALLVVRDTGVGIAPENLARIFTYGFTTKRNGHGFGLHSSALAAKELGGALSVSSDGVGRGAAFTLELPIDQS